MAKITRGGRGLQPSHCLCPHFIVRDVDKVEKCVAMRILLDFSLTVKAATLIFISGCGSAISSAKEGKSGFIYNFVKS